MQDINQLYELIVEKNQLFAHYPRLQKYKKAERLIVNWFQDHRNCAGICCIGSSASDIQNIKYLAEKANLFCEYLLCGNEIVKELEQVQWTKFDCVLFISRHGETQTGLWLCEHGIKYESLYDFLAIHDLYFEDEYHRLNIEVVPNTQDGASMDTFQDKHDNRNNLIAEFLIQKEKYMKESKDECKVFYWEKQFALAVYMKNFVLAEELIEEANVAKLQIGKRYLNAWNELKELIKEIKGHLKERLEEDIILIWMDAIGYGDGDAMSYFQTQIKEGVVFKNAFTVTPTTNPTIRAIVNSKFEVDDYGYRDTEIDENCRLISYMQRMGYSVKAMSGRWNGWKEELKSDVRHDFYTPASVILWDMWRHLLLGKQKLFLLVHLLIETHYPHLSVKMSYGKTKENYKEGRMEMDEQMQFYLSTINKNAVKIFMSDHGQWSNIKNTHVNLVVTQQKLVHREIEGMFSLIDFYRLMKQIVEQRNIDERYLTQEYIKLQVLDHYNPNWVKDIIAKRKNLELGLFGYRGIVDQKYIYQHFNNGKEILVDRRKLIYEPHIQPEADEVCDTSLLPYYRELAGENPEGFYEEEKFKYTKYQYRLYDNFIKHKNKAFELLNQLVEKFPDNSLAIRPGGEHSMEVFFWLSEENKKKIYCFIDNDPKCNCSKLGDAKIIPFSEAFSHKAIKAVILSSYVNLAKLKKEAESYPEYIQRLDIYDYFAQNGCKLEHDFFDACMDAEGYEVGFPM